MPSRSTRAPGESDNSSIVATPLNSHNPSRCSRASPLLSLSVVDRHALSPCPADSDHLLLHFRLSLSLFFLLFILAIEVAYKLIAGHFVNLRTFFSFFFFSSDCHFTRDWIFFVFCFCEGLLI